MATVADVARDLLGSMASDTSMPIAVRWIDNRYRELVSKVRFRHLRKLGELTVPAAISTGTVSVTLGSTSVAGSGTTWATAPAVFTTGAAPYWSLRANSVWHLIDAISGNTTLTLSSSYSETTNSAASYYIVKRFHPVGSSARWLGKFVVQGIGRDLGEPIAMDELDSIDPRRTLIGSEPVTVAQAQNGPSSGIMVEVYPYPSSVTMIHYTYWDIPDELDVDSTIPAQVDGYILKEAAYIDYCRLMSSQREKEGKLESAAYWRNEGRAQETKWQLIMRDAIKADRGSDDLSFILQRNAGPSYSESILTKRENTIET